MSRQTKSTSFLLHRQGTTWDTTICSMNVVRVLIFASYDLNAILPAMPYSVSILSAIAFRFELRPSTKYFGRPFLGISNLNVTSPVGCFRSISWTLISAWSLLCLHVKSGNKYLFDACQDISEPGVSCSCMSGMPRTGQILTYLLPCDKQVKYS